MKKPTIFDIANEFIKFNFSRSPYYSEVGIKYIYLMGTISRTVLYGCVVLDFIRDHYVLGIVLLLEALFLSFVNMNNFMYSYTRRLLYEQELEIRFDIKESNDERK